MKTDEHRYHIFANTSLIVLILFGAPTCGVLSLFIVYSICNVISMVMKRSKGTQNVDPIKDKCE